MVPTRIVKDKLFKCYIPEEKLRSRIKEMAAELNKHYQDRNPVMLVILTGAFRFAGDLSTFIDFGCEWRFVKLSSYQGMSSTGNVQMDEKHFMDLKGREVIIIEDIVDSGKSMSFFLKEIRKCQPSSVYLTSLFVKSEVLQGRVHIDLVGFNIPDKFIVGYGLDYDEAGRELNGIWQVVE